MLPLMLKAWWLKLSLVSEASVGREHPSYCTHWAGDMPSWDNGALFRMGEVDHSSQAKVFRGCRPKVGESLRKNGGFSYTRF